MTHDEAKQLADDAGRTPLADAVRSLLKELDAYEGWAAQGKNIAELNVSRWREARERVEALEEALRCACAMVDTGHAGCRNRRPWDDRRCLCERCRGLRVLRGLDETDEVEAVEEAAR